MKDFFKNISMYAAIALSFNPFNIVLANETMQQVKTKHKKKHNYAHYDEMAMGVNAPIYDYYAQKIKETTHVTKGVCLDVGSNGGYMGLALSKITDLDFIFLDISAEALKNADKHIQEYKLEKKAKTLVANVQDIPLADNSIDLVISRGSIPFWEDPQKGLSEIYRVMKKGAKAYVGGGKGDAQTRKKVDDARAKQGLEAFANKKTKHGDGMKRDYAKMLQDAGIYTFKIHNGDDGKWIEMWK
jgi:ubiquinone/menaquinone biosynthesis C-methylase UbiE